MTRVFAAIIGLAAGAVAALLIINAVAATPNDYQACEHQNRFPVRVHIQPGVDAYPWHWAIVEWNAAFPGSFVEVSANADVEVVPSKTTYVDLPCDGHPAVVHSGTDVDLIWWATHELAHTLAVRDRIRPTTNPTNYLNPAFCSDDDDGVNSYCSSRWSWLLTQYDHDMMIALGYRWRVYVGQISN